MLPTPPAFFGPIGVVFVRDEQVDNKEGNDQDDQGYGQKEEDGYEEPYEGVQLQEGSRDAVHLLVAFLLDGWNGSLSGLKFVT